MKLTAKIGLFFLIALIIFVGFTIKVKRLDFLNNHYFIYTYFPDINGVEPGDPVKLSGVKIGFIDDVSPETDKVKVTMEIEKKYKIKKDAKAKLSIESLMYGKYVSINFGTSNEYLKDGDFIQMSEGADMEKLLDNLYDISSDAKILVKSFNTNQDKLLGNLNDLISENKPKVNRILTKADNVMEAIKKDDVENIIHDIKNTTATLTKVSSNLQSISDKIMRGEGTIGKLVYDENVFNELTGAVNNAKLAFAKFYSILEKNDTDVGEIVVSLKTAMPDLKKSINNIKEITDSINKGEGTLGKIIKDDTLYVEVKEAVKSINKGIEDQREQSVISTFADAFFGIFGF